MRSLIIPVALFSVACGSGSSPSAPTPAELTAIVTDPAGDAVARPGVSASPDLIGATLVASQGTLTVAVTFAAGTFSQTDTLVSVSLDTDENPNTGSPGIDSGAGDAALIGTDYLISIVSPRGSGQAAIFRATGPNQFVPIGTAAVSFPSPGQLRLTVPLALFGGDDGRLKFKVTCSQYLTDTTTTGITDYMPDLGLPAGAAR